MATKPKAVQSIRKVRHWKQRYKKNARFVFRKAQNWPEVTKAGKVKPGGKRIHYPAGSIIPEAVILNMGAKVRRWWEARLIELHEFKDPNVKTGVVNMRDPSGKLGVGKAPKKKADGKKGGKKKGKGGKARPKFEPKPEHSDLVLDLVAEGASQKAIAKTVGCSPSTLKRYFADELKGNEPPPADDPQTSAASEE